MHRESTSSSNFLCAQEQGYTCTLELHPLYPNFLNILNVAIVRVHVYPDNVPGNRYCSPTSMSSGYMCTWIIYLLPQ